MKGTLTKQRKVLDFFTEDDTTVLFNNPEAENGSTLFPVLKQDYEDMGRPEQITVTIEPGDLLNPIECDMEVPQ